MFHGALLLGAPRVALPLVGVNTEWRPRSCSVQVRAQRVGSELEEKSRDEPRVLCEEVQQWGVGSGPIFTIVRSSDGGVVKVSVDEEEIVVRCGFQSMVSQRSYDVSDRISKARQMAREIELGRLIPPTDSLLFKFVVDSKEETPGDKNEVSSEGVQAHERLTDMSTEGVQSPVITDEGVQSPVTTDEFTEGEGVQSPVTARTLESPAVSQTLVKVGTESWRPFLTVGLVAGLAMAVTSRITVLLQQRTSQQPVPSKSQTKDVEEPTLVGAGDEERLTRIRDMAEQARMEEERELRGRQSVPLPVQYAATARAQLGKKRRQAANQGVDVFALAQQLDEVRRAGEERFVFEKPPVRSTNGNGKVQVRASQDEKGDGIEDAGVQKRVMPRIITCYKEAVEVLAERKLRDKRKSGEGGELLIPAQMATNDETDRLVTPENKSETGERSKSNDQQSEEQAETLVRKGHKRADYTVWKEDDFFREILLKAQENDRAGKDLFHGMNPDAKQILFEGLEKELGKEAEPIKAWINERNAAYARALKESDESRKTESCIIPKYVVDKQPQPESKPQRTIVTTGGGGAGVKTQETSNSKSKSLKPNKKKVWPKELQRRYDAETDPKMRRLLKDIGKDLDEWIPEEKLEADERLFSQGTEGRLELLRRWHAELKEEARKKGVDSFDTTDLNATRYEKMQQRIQKWTDMFGPNALIHKYQDYKPAKADSLWWLDLRYVACIVLKNEEQKMAPGLYSMNMALESDKEPRMHVVGFEEQKDALNFCRIMVPELDKLGGATGAGIIPFEPKELLKEAKSGGFTVTVLKKGQVELYAGKPLEEVEARILEIGRDVYVQEQLRQRSIDIKAVMEDLGRDL